MKINGLLDKFKREDTIDVNLGDGNKFVIAQFADHNQTYRANLLKLQLKSKDVFRLSPDPDEAFGRDVELFASVVLVDWSIKDDDDKKIPFSVKNAVDLFTGGETPEDIAARRVLFFRLNAMAHNDDLFRVRAEQLEDAAKN